MTKPHVRVYVDDNPTPVVDGEWPTQLTLDTHTLGDGPHRLTVRATDQRGVEGIEEIPFHVQNGPGIMVSGLQPGSTRRGTLQLNIDAFSADDPFDARRAEARSSIPTWVWVLITLVFAWVVYYVATMWDVPAKYATTPTFGAPATSQQQASPAAPDSGS
ncbi:MAG: cytochrome C [Nevskiaceae bacterium]|nr:MAG: cytochrome C [Nevskiaceae bacterium]TBR74837.1 MAG: cytochrome C [Nevskiaceae bacterium]